MKRRCCGFTKNPWIVPFSSKPPAPLITSAFYISKKEKESSRRKRQEATFMNPHGAALVASRSASFLILVRCNLAVIWNWIAVIFKNRVLPKFGKIRKCLGIYVI